MVIYQKQPRVAHRQHYTVLQQQWSPRAAAPAPALPESLSPSSCPSCVNIHCGRKTAFSSAWSGMPFRSSCFQREESEKAKKWERRETTLSGFLLGANILSFGICRPDCPHSAQAALNSRGKGHADISWHSESCVCTHQQQQPTPDSGEYRGNLDFHASQLPVWRSLSLPADTSLTFWHLKKPSGRIPSALLFLHPTDPTQGASMFESCPSWWTIYTENSSFQRTTCPCWKLQCRPPEDLCCGGFFKLSKNITVMALSATLPPPYHSPPPQASGIVNLTKNVGALWGKKRGGQVGNLVFSSWFPGFTLAGPALTAATLWCVSERRGRGAGWNLHPQPSERATGPQSWPILSDTNVTLHEQSWVSAGMGCDRVNQN